MTGVGFLSGIAMATFAFSGLFFLKFWRASKDRFFLMFSIACGLISLERLVAYFVVGTREALWSPAVESSSWVYVIRMAAFIAIIIAFWEKNRPQRKL